MEDCLSRLWRPQIIITKEHTHMAKWQMTLNGNPATSSNGEPLPIFDDGFGDISRADPKFKEAQATAAKHLAIITDHADGMTLVGERDNSYNRASGTHTYNA